MFGGEKLNISKKMAIMALSCVLMSMTIATIASAQWDGEWDGGTPAGAEAAFLGLTGICCFIVLIPLIIGILLGIWVYKDAEKRGKSGIVWLLIVWVLGIIGLIIWLVIRPPIGGEKSAAASDRKCPNCGRPIPMDARACPYCAKKFEE